ncbi:hypothetical protein BD769DRAFT_336271 [Suillus cothurnatus]|nr:hypothetical protein BD769DRAFT_336271 [Suillus cothurnatus]
MIETTQLSSVQNSAINYLRIIADYEDARQEMIGGGMMEPLLWCLKASGVNSRALKDVLEMIARNKTLRGEIIENGKILAEMLSSHYPVEIIRMTDTFKSLSSYGEIRQKVQEMDPHHHPHEHDQYTSASQAIESIIGAYDKTPLQPERFFFLFLFLISIGAFYSPLLVAST